MYNSQYYVNLRGKGVILMISSPKSSSLLDFGGSQRKFILKTSVLRSIEDG